MPPRRRAAPGPGAHVDGRAVARQDKHAALRAAHQQGPAARDERERGGLGQRPPRPGRGALARLARRQRARPAQHAPRQAHLRRAARPSAAPGELARAPHAPAPRLHVYARAAMPRTVCKSGARRACCWGADHRDDIAAGCGGVQDLVRLVYDQRCEAPLQQAQLHVQRRQLPACDLRAPRRRCSQPASRVPGQHRLRPHVSVARANYGRSTCESVRMVGRAGCWHGGVPCRADRRRFPQPARDALQAAAARLHGPPDPRAPPRPAGCSGRL